MNINVSSFRQDNWGKQKIYKTKTTHSHKTKVLGLKSINIPNIIFLKIIMMIHT